jgi:selenophosphate synthetase-related protein
VALERWLTSFPSYGFVLSVRPEHSAGVLARFAARGIAAAACGTVTADRTLHLSHQGQERALWDIAADPFILAAPAEALP